jgi:hypothetical protein
MNDKRPAIALLALAALAWTHPAGAQTGPALAPGPAGEGDADVGEIEGEEEPGGGAGDESTDWEMSDEELASYVDEEEEEEPGEAPPPAAEAAPEPEGWKDKIDIRGYFETDLRSTVPNLPGQGKHIEDIGVLDDYTFIRSENTFRLRGEFQISPKAKAVGDMELIFTGMAVGDSFSDLTLREKVDPFRFESDALYLQFVDLFPGFDVRLGRQVVVWGTADKFSPTNNLNALDLEDPLLFGEAIANEMISLTYAPWFAVEGKRMTVFEELALSVVWIPIFRPAQLPFWSVAAMQSPSLFRQQVHDRQMFSLLDLQDLFVGEKGGQLDWDIRYRRPNLSFTNMQGAVKLSWILLGIDMSVSYFNGFDDMPRAEWVYAEDLDLGERGLPPLEVGDGMYELLEKMDDLTGTTILNRVRLSYPRMQVLGMDFSTSLDFLGGLGLWGEVAFFFHEDLYNQVRTSSAWIDIAGTSQEVPGIERNYLIRDYPKGWFWKGTFGMDYSFTSWWYLNVQYIHGFIDEFGANRPKQGVINLKDYLMAGMDFRLVDTKLLIRLFSVVQFPYRELCRADGHTCQRGASAVLYPEITLNFLRGSELSVGALLYVGGYNTKFGSPMAGPNTVFVKGRISI